jgi:2'-phosphotransferase
VLSSDKQRFTLKPLPELDPPPAMPPLPTSNPADYLVRANQGHSIAVDSAALLTPVDAANAPRICVHGTNDKAWRAIWESGGLRRMGRNHIHFAQGLPKGFKEVEAGVEAPSPSEVQPVKELGPEEVADADAAAADMATLTVAEGEAGASEAKDVISGMRNSSTILVYVDVVKAMGMGIKFWVSDNGVVLSEGNEQGFVPVEVFAKVEDRKANAIIVRDGVLLENAEVGKGKKKGQ